MQEVIGFIVGVAIISRLIYPLVLKLQKKLENNNEKGKE